MKNSSHKDEYPAMQSNGPLPQVMFMITDDCRRDPWDEFYDNQNKGQSSFYGNNDYADPSATPHNLPDLGPDCRCCDNCNPDLFPIETLRVFGLNAIKTGRCKPTTDKMLSELSLRLCQVVDNIVSRDWPNQHIWTSRMLLQDDVIENFARQAKQIQSVDDLHSYVGWHWCKKYGQEILECIVEVCAKFAAAEDVQNHFAKGLVEMLI